MNVALCAPAVQIRVVTAHAHPDLPGEADVEVFPVVAIRSTDDGDELLLIHPAMGRELCTVAELVALTGIVTRVVVGDDPEEMERAKRIAASDAVMREGALA